MTLPIKNRSPMALWLFLFALISVSSAPGSSDVTKKKLDKVEYAKLAQETGRYGTMAKSMKKAVEAIVEKGGELNEEEQELLKFAYRIIVDARRTAREIIYDRKKNKDISEQYNAVLMAMKEEVEQEQSKICNDVMELMDKLIVHTSEENKIFVLMMKADYRRYYAEMKDDSEAFDLSKAALDDYMKALNIMTKRNMNPAGILKIGLATKITVLYNDNLYMPKEAYELAAKTVQEADAEALKRKLTEEEKQDLTLLRTNMDLYKTYIKSST